MKYGFTQTRTRMRCRIKPLSLLLGHGKQGERLLFAYGIAADAEPRTHASLQTRLTARKVGIEHLPLLSCLVGASSDFYRFRDIGWAALGFDVDACDVFADHTQRYQNEPAHQKEHAQKRRIARWHGGVDKLLDNDFDQQNQPNKRGNETRHRGNFQRKRGKLMHSADAVAH